MNMKKLLLFLLIFFALLLVGCDDELYVIDTTATQEAASENLAISNFHYTNYEKENAVVPGEYVWYTMTSRGILFLPNNGILTVYNPETGTLNTLCPDPLCSHQPYSGCPYGNCIFTGSIPIPYMNRLYYFVKDQYLDNNTVISEYKIYSTDISAQDIKKHYDSNGNYIFGLAIKNDCLYFLESINEHYCLLKSVDLSTGLISTIPTDGQDDLVILSFICLNDRIYYMLDNGQIHSCDLELENINFEYDTKRAPTIYGREDLEAIFWCLDNTIYMYDINTKLCSKLVELESTYRIFNMFVEDEGIYYQAFPAETNYTMAYDEYTKIVSGHNPLYLIEPQTGTQYIYELPDSLYLEANAVTVCNGVLIAQTYIENNETKMLAGRPFYAYDLTTGSLYLITEVRGF